MAEFFMLDDSFKAGTDFEGLNEVLETVTAATAYEKVKMDHLAVLLFKKKATGDSDDRLMTYYLEPNNGSFEEDENGNLSIGLSYVSKSAIINGVGEEMYKEMMHHGFCLQNTSTGELYFPSEGLELSIDARIGAHSARYTIADEKKSIGHFLDMVAGFSKKVDVTLVTRTESNVKKLMSVMTSKYAVIRLTYLMKIIGMIKKLDEVRCLDWMWTQRHTFVTMELPNKDIARFYTENGVQKNITSDMQPVIAISTGDCGDNALNVKAGFRKRGSRGMIIIGDFNKKHMGEINEDQMLKDIDEKMLSEYYKLPDRLLELYSIEISGNGSSFTNPVEDVYRNCLDLLGAKKLIGIKRTSKLLDNLKIQVNYAEKYNAYDVAMEFMTLTDRLEGLDKYYIEELQKRIYQMIMKKDFWKVEDLKLK